MTTGSPSTPRVVIIGGGFAGLYAAKRFARAPVAVTVVDRRNHHLFQPLLYQVATAALNPSDIAAPIRTILRGQRNTRVILGDVTAIDTKNRVVTMTDGPLAFDYLIVATGATHSYFGNDQWEPFAPGLKSIEDALEIRKRVLLAYEAAEKESDPAGRDALLTFVVVGGGPTGAELAGALAEIGRHAMERDFRAIDPASVRVILVEGIDRVLSSFDASLSRSAEEQLTRIGVEVRTNCRVTAIDDRGVTMGDETIAAATVLWGAGVQASPVAKFLGVPLDKAGRVIVERDLSIPGSPEVFVAGDLAHFEQDGRLLPGVAQPAMQGGVHAAANIVRRIRGEGTLPFRYHDKGSMATIGRAAAIAQFRRLKLSGLPAWLAWLFVHIVFLIGFRNRTLVLIQWAWAYLTFQRGARLITGEVKYGRQE
ncbi:MAG: NAD(P)/FAD-dependent oxidoreductase [Thermoanaerobaculia bacterium]|jgi:NADH dehydrogenase